MTIDRFTKERFEKALPVHNCDKHPLWYEKGFQGGEFVYGIDVNKDGHGAPWVTIVIRSSIGSDGYAKETGKDSIRVILMRGNKPHGSKSGHWITRTAGWEERLTEKLRFMYRRCMKLSTCPKCNLPKAVFKSKKDGSLFQACPEHFQGSYEKYED